MRNHTWAQSAGVAAAFIAGAFCVGCSAGDPKVSLEIRVVEATPADDLTEMSMVVWGGQRTYYAHNEILLTEEDVIAALVIKKDNGEPAIRLVLNEEGQEKLLRVTRKHVGSRLGVIIDGQLQCASPIEAPVKTGVLMVTGHMLMPAARRCSRALTHAV